MGDYLVRDFICGGKTGPESKYVLPTQIFWQDFPVSLLIFLLEHFLFPHHQLGTNCLHISALLTNYQP